MKAKEYFERDKNILIEAGQEETKEKRVLALKRYAANIVRDFRDETVVIFDSRKARSDKAILSIIHEQNQKWNALVKLFEGAYGFSPIRRNGFRNYVDVVAEIARKKEEETASAQDISAPKKVEQLAES